MAQKDPEPIERSVDEEGASPSRKTSCGGQGPQVEACSNYVREKRLVFGARKWSHAMAELKQLCFNWQSPFLKLVQSCLTSGRLVCSCCVGAFSVQWLT